MRPFLEGDPCLPDLEAVLEEAYGSFHHPAVAPLRQIGPNEFLLELFHGPTLAFKDVAMQVVARLMNRALMRKGAHATVIGATSGDTGAAAIEAFRGLEAIDIFILHPKGRVSDVQRRQMTTATEPNVHNIALEGTFDDCQAIVKALFADAKLRDTLALDRRQLDQLRPHPRADPLLLHRGASRSARPTASLAFSVPTGNFGDIFAGYAARAMGLPVARLVIATNLNDSLTRALGSGVYEPHGVIATSSPSMDIQLASNFERLLFELAGRDATRVRALMEELRKTGAFRLNDDRTCRPARPVRRAFGGRARDRDDHSLAGRGDRRDRRSAYRSRRRRSRGTRAAKGATPMVVLATAHPAKFPELVERATGGVPEQPERLRLRLGQHERCTVLANDYATVADFIAQPRPHPRQDAERAWAPRRGRRVSVERSKLANGLTVISHAMAEVETVSLGIWIGAGSRSEAHGEHGVAHFLEHMAFKGTARRSARDIAEEIEAVGGELNAATGVDSTAYYARVLRKDLAARARHFERHHRRARASTAPSSRASAT